MNRHLFTMAFWLGAMAVVWVGAGFGGSNLLALMVTALIGTVYVFGALELRQFRQANTSLTTALAAMPDKLSSLADWLGRVHPSLQNPVRMRIEGERTGLPGPALTPYLVGLLVMLGMLGTFLGMVVTLNGAAFSLEGSTDLQAIRAALAAPIKGLGLAFGTSVAGVAASSMLGLMSALSRRERMLAAQLLDTHIATSLRGFSLTHQRQETYKALQFQAQALPDVVDKLQAMMVQMEHLSQQLNGRLLSNQDQFHSEVKGLYSDLASSVDQSLKDSLAQHARVAGESLTPVVEAAMRAIAQDTSVMHERVMDTTHQQVTSLVSGVGQALNAWSHDFEQRSGSLLVAVNNAYTTLQADQATGDRQRLAAWTGSLETTATALHREWQHAGAQTLAQQQHLCTTLTKSAQEVTEQAQASARNTLGEITRLMTCSEELIRTRMASEADWTQQSSERMNQLTGLLHAELGALRDEEAQRGQAAVERLGDLQTALSHHLTTLGTALEDPIRRLIETASEAPRAAAEVIGQLRQEMSNSVARDNDLLEERSRILETLNALLGAIHHAAAEQRSVIDALVASSATALNHTSSQFAERVGLETAKLSETAAHVTSSAVEVSCMGESFGLAVHSFHEANEKLITNLQRIETAMDKSMLRSDEQLAYYVAQAREIIDLSVLSQKEIFEELRQLPSRQALSTQEVR